MAKRGRPPKTKNALNDGGSNIKEYRHTAKRKNIPPVGLAAQGQVQEAPRFQYAYNPHLPPVLRSDDTGKSDKLPEVLQTARERSLTADEAKLLAEALRRHEPWLEWAGKREKKAFEVEPVALHIHERVSAQAILRVAARQDVERSLFADPEQEYREAVQFYQHDVDWANRLILGDSLEVMASLTKREGLAGKVQMIYMDPPYGIRFKSNFQTQIGNVHVKDKEADLTREPEMVKAYRDTWTLGVHSYLAYLRDRLVLCRELLTDSGSIFLQISDENLHRVRAVLDEVFGSQNQVVTIVVKKKGNQKGGTMEPINDYILWYAKDKSQVRVRRLYSQKFDADVVPDDFDKIQLPSGELRSPVEEDYDRLEDLLKAGGELVYSDQLTSGGEFRTQLYPIQFQGGAYLPAKGNSWKHNETDMSRVLRSERIMLGKEQIRFRKFLGDFGCTALTNFWADVAGAKGKVYVVQTNTRVIERCLLMASDPGDLVLDPTCGSGTTAYVAEQRGRRWITIDTSRVAVSLTRQRLLTSTFPYYKLRPVTAEDQQKNPNGTWLRNGGNERYTLQLKTVPHITLKSIAQNTTLDPIFAKHQAVLDEKLKTLNAALKKVAKSTHQELAYKYEHKSRTEGMRALTEADRRRWLLPPDNRDRKAKVAVPADFGGWYEWEVPFDADPDWPKELQHALLEFRKAWRAKMDEVNACIAASAEQEDLVDQPEIVSKTARVSGPFTVESVLPLEESLEGETFPIGGAPEELGTFSESASVAVTDPQSAEAYLDKMLRLLRVDGVRFPDNKSTQFSRLEPAPGEFLHADGEWETEKGAQRVAISFGPQHGPVTVYQVENALRQANRKGYDALVLAGFSFDGAAQAVIQEEEQDPANKMRIHMAHIRPDASPSMNQLLKEQPNSQIFTVFGSPRVKLKSAADGQYQVEMEGVDIYDPVGNTILPTTANKVAAWFLDGDYDGRCFCITQAFFPDPAAWHKLARALKGVIDEDRFERLSGTVSLPFPVGKYKRAAVKVIDPRGNEVMSVLKLSGRGGTGHGKQ